MRALLITMAIFQLSGAANMPPSRHRDSPAESAAHNLHNKKDYVGAINGFKKIIAAEPGNAYAIAWLGLCYFEQHKFTAARKEYERAIALDPKNAQAGVLGYTLLFYYQRGMMDEEALAMLENIHKVEPDRPEYFLTRSEIMESQENFAEAKAAASRYIALRPDQESGYFRRACVEEQMKDFRAAIADLTKNIEVNKTPTSAYLKRARNYEQLGEFRKEIADYTTVINIGTGKAQKARDVQIATALANRAYAYSKVGEVEKALKDYDTVIQKAFEGHSAMQDGLMKQAITAMNNRAELLIKLKRYPEAITTYDTMIAHARDYGESFGGFYRDRARVYRLMGKVDLAARDEAQAARVTAADRGFLLPHPNKSK